MTKTTGHWFVYEKRGVAVRSSLQAVRHKARSREGTGTTSPESRDEAEGAWGWFRSGWSAATWLEFVGLGHSLTRARNSGFNQGSGFAQRQRQFATELSNTFPHASDANANSIAPVS